MSRDDVLESLLARYFEFAESGVTPDLESLCSGDPDLAARLRSLVATAGDLPEEFSGIDPWIGRRLDARYVLGRRLGSGGMGVVHEAVDERLGRTVAVKILPGAQWSNPELLARFRREAQVLAGLDHAGIARVHDIQEGDPTFMVMDRIEGVDLSRCIEQFSWVHADSTTSRDGPRDARDRWSELLGLDGAELPEHLLRPWPAVVAQFGIEICDALDSAHAAGVVHRDLKPGNLMLDRSGRIRLLDFGLAAVAGDGSLTATRAMLGTPAYMAPEQVRGETADTRTDLHGVGVTLFELLYLERPFRGTSSEVLAAVQFEEPSPSAERRHRVPRDFAAVCQQAMRKSPADRYPTAAELGADLRRLLRYEPVVARGSRWPRALRRVGGLARRYAPPARIAVPAGLLVAALMVGGAVTLAGPMASRLERESNAREARRGELRAALSPTLGLSGTAEERLRDPGRGSDLAALDELLALDADDLEARYLRWLVLVESAAAEDQAKAGEDRRILQNGIDDEILTGIDALADALRNRREISRVIDLTIALAPRAETLASLLERLRITGLFECGRLAEGKSMLGERSDRVPHDTAFLWFFQGAAESAYGRIGNDSLDAFAAVLERAPDHLPSMLNLARAYRRRGSLELAEQLARRAMAHTPSHPNYPMQLHLVLRDQQRFAEAREVARERLDGVLEEFSLATVDVHEGLASEDPDAADALFHRGFETFSRLADLPREARTGIRNDALRTNLSVAAALSEGSLEERCLAVARSLRLEPHTEVLADYLERLLLGDALECGPELRRALGEYQCARRLAEDPTDWQTARRLAESLAAVAPVDALMVIRRHGDVLGDHIEELLGRLTAGLDPAVATRLRHRLELDGLLEVR